MPHDGILVTRRGAIGDVLACEPALRSLREENPSPYPIIFQTRHPDVLIGCPHIDGVVGLRSGSSEFDGYRKIDLDMAYENRPGIQRQIAICDAAEVPYPGPSRYWKNSPHGFHPSQSDGDSRPLVVFGMWAQWPCRRWDSERWRDVSSILESSGYRTIEVCQTDSQIGIGNAFQGSWWQAVEMISTAKVFVGVDSALMWIALGLAIPSVILFGPTDPNLITDHPNLIPLMSDNPENGCHHRGEHPKIMCMCNRTSHPGLEGISSRRVVEAIEKSAGTPQ